MSLESRAIKSISGHSESCKVGNTVSNCEPTYLPQQTSLTLLGGTLPLLWFGLQDKNNKGMIGF